MPDVCGRQLSVAWSGRVESSDRRTDLGSRQQPPGADRRRGGWSARCPHRDRHLESRERRGLTRAAGAGIETLVVDHRSFPSRDEFDRAVAQELLSRGVRLVCLAGFMRLVGAPLLDAFPNAILNIHPSLLPAFPGVEAQRQALDHGVRITGATVHLVTSELDAGPIVLQASVPVRTDDTPETLSARILVEEHRLYPAAVQLILDGHWS